MKHLISTKNKRHIRSHGTILISICTCLVFLTVSCNDSGISSNKETINETNMSLVPSKAKGAENGGPYDNFGAVTYDLDATPNGSILVTQNNTIREIYNGGVKEIAEIPAIPGAPINGVEVIGRGSYYVTSGGLDLAAGAGLWHVSKGNMKLVGDIEAFETNNDPDANGGPGWKNVLCEEDPSQGFTSGPQSNPYHLKALSGSEMLIADAAGNSLLKVKKNGEINWIAVFTPPVNGSGNYRFLKTALSDPSVDCYVQPVPTSVDIGPDGAIYVGELTGSPATPGWSRVWRIDKGASNVTCPSAECTVAIDGLTSVIDLEFGPDGMLYVVEYDKNGWAAAFATPAGGTVKRCDPNTGDCEIIEGDSDFVLFPTAISFDKRGNLWLLENNLVEPVVRRLN